MYCINNEKPKDINLLNKNDFRSRNFTTRKWYVKNDINNTSYGGLNGNNTRTVKFETTVLKPNLCDYSDAYILVTGQISIDAGNADTDVAFKNCAPFANCTIQINDEHIETAVDLDIVIPMYNLIEYSDNYQDSSATLSQYKRDEPPIDINNNIPTNNSKSFAYNAGLLGDAAPIDVNNAADPSRKIDNGKIVVSLNYVSNLFRALEMPLIHCKVHLELTWKKDCLLSNSDGNIKFQIQDTKLYVPVVTLSKDDKKDFTKQQNEGFKRSIYWNEHKSKIDRYNNDPVNYQTIDIDPSFQGVNRLLVLAFSDEGVNRVTRDGHQKYYLPRVDIKDYNVIVHGRNFYDNPISSQIQKYTELKK